MRWLILVLSPTLLMVACSAKRNKPTKPAVDAAAVELTPAVKHYGIPTLIKGPLDPVAVACKTDADCTTTCHRDGNCCPQPCDPCLHAYRKDFVKRLEKQQLKMCERARCPPAKCAPPTFATHARCRQRKCVVERKPLR